MARLSGVTGKERPRPLPRTPVALSVLNLLNERPMHPYEMRVHIRERGHDRAFKIRESSIYDTVGRLADRGSSNRSRSAARGGGRNAPSTRLPSGRDELLTHGCGNWPASRRRSTRRSPRR